MGNINEDKKVKAYIDKCRNEVKSNILVSYIKIFLISNLIAIFIILTPFDSHPVKGFIVEAFAYLIALFAVLLFCLYLMEIRKAVSFNLVVELIERLTKKENGHNDFHKYLRQIKSLDHASICHPISMFLYGILFTNNGYLKEGKFLIKRSINKDKRLEDIKINGHLKEKDGKFLVDCLLSEKQFKIVKHLIHMWSDKKLRIILFSILISFLIINYISQLVQ